MNITFTIPSETRFLSVLQAISISKAWMPTDLPYKQRIGVAIFEACTNALRHGNKFNEDKILLLDINISDAQLIIEITDEGEGFVIDGYLPPYPSDLYNKSFLIKRNCLSKTMSRIIDNSTIEFYTEELKEPDLECINGGLGLTIVIKVMDSVIYHQLEPNKNSMILTKQW